MSALWREYWEIQKARMQKSKEAMEEYDLSVYFPALKSLRERCGIAGHVRGKWHDNGIGWSWFYCNNCGSQMEIEGPDGQTKP